MIATARERPGNGTLIPLLLCACLGLAAELYFMCVLGFHVFQRLYFWPGLLLTVFWLYCLAIRRFHPWHRFFWRFACIWSGFWTILGVMMIALSVFSPMLLFTDLPWLVETRFSPYIAFFLHAVVWACSVHVLRSLQAKS
jgi:hypothetical protein